MLRFVLASLLPAGMILAGFVRGGAWPYSALATMTVGIALADKFTALNQAPADPRQARAAADALSLAQAAAHFALLLIGVPALAGGGLAGKGLAGGGMDWPALDWPAALAAGLAMALYFGQVSHPNAHELIHRPGRWLRRLGAAIYVSLLFGHHVSAHLRVHHVHVATRRDPNSAPRGMGFWRFWGRAGPGSFRAGLRAETAARRRRMRGRADLRAGPDWRHPYVAWIGGALLCLGIAWALAGPAGVAIYLGLAIYAQAQILLADYVQHYGLRRAENGAGRAEPAGPRHSWNARPWASAAMMLNAPRHSDHHLNPGRVFPALRLDPAAMPVLPYSMPVMAVIALWPPLWRRVMDPLVAQWAQAEAPRPEAAVGAGAGPGVAAGPGAGPGAGAGARDLPRSAHATGAADSPDAGGRAEPGRKPDVGGGL